MAEAFTRIQKRPLFRLKVSCTRSNSLPFSVINGKLSTS